MASGEKEAARPARQYDRATTHHDLSIVYEGRAERLLTRVPDVSPRGMFINTGRRFPEGAVLKIEFRLTRSGYQVQARAEVRYCLPEVGVGVEFVEISAEAQQAIADELEAWRRG